MSLRSFYLPPAQILHKQWLVWSIQIKSVRSQSMKLWKYRTEWISSNRWDKRVRTYQMVCEIACFMLLKITNRPNSLVVYWKYKMRNQLVIGPENSKSRVTNAWQNSPRKYETGLLNFLNKIQRIMWLLGARILSLTVDLYRLSTEGRGPWIPTRRIRTLLSLNGKLSGCQVLVPFFIYQRRWETKEWKTHTYNHW